MASWSESIFVVSGPAMIFNESVICRAWRNNESCGTESSFKANAPLRLSFLLSLKNSVGGTAAHKKTKAKSIRNVNVFVLTDAKLLIKWRITSSFQ